MKSIHYELLPHIAGILLLLFLIYLVFSGEFFHALEALEASH